MIHSQPPAWSRRVMLKTAAAAALSVWTPAFSPGRLGATEPVPAPVAGPGASPAVPAKFPNFELESLRTEEIAPGFHVLLGPGGNVGVLVGKEGDDGSPLVIDTGIRARSAEVLRTVAALSPGGVPVRRVVNTHWHYDHVGGNEAFARAGATVFAHVNVRRRLSEDTFVELMARTVPAAPEVARPGVTFEDGVSFSAADVRVIHLPPAHTDGDSVVHLPTLNVIQTGDVFWNGGYPLIDYSTGGSLDGMIAATERVLALADGKTRIVPGHGPVGSKADVEAFRTMLITAGERIRPLFAAGKSLEETLAAKPTAELDAKWGRTLRDPDFFVRAVYGGMKAAQSQGRP